ncbi:nuclear transport factor 2 family protein [Ralstonia soli]|uniref:Nuclear transport factor 2 family protein n=1 Tax=Ralstonia soli TaxID=2953896 RepID=A0ABT1AG90_9RALS|nr:nuclear transport factor 2 family protein [Ralstonia soli]MCO5397409.1 nuclear transport factor 2 family protein [Ralstonia soli]
MTQAAKYDLQTLSDHHNIRELIVDYATAIDSRDFDALDAIFTPDAYIDYRAMGGVDGRYPEVKAWLRSVLPAFPNTQHMVGNVSVRLDGDAARARTICFNPMEVVLEDGRTQVMFLGLWYVDRFKRGAHGWRMVERVEERCYGHNVPAALSRATG